MESKKKEGKLIVYQRLYQDFPIFNIFPVFIIFQEVVRKLKLSQHKFDKHRFIYQ